MHIKHPYRLSIKSIPITRVRFLQLRLFILGGGTQDPPMLVKHPYYRLPVKSILAPRARFLQLCLLILGGKPLRPMYSFNIPIDFHLSLYLFQGRDSCNSVSSSWGVNLQTPLSN